MTSHCVLAIHSSARSWKRRVLKLQPGFSSLLLHFKCCWLTEIRFTKAAELGGWIALLEKLELSRCRLHNAAIFSVSLPLNEFWCNPAFDEATAMEMQFKNESRLRQSFSRTTAEDRRRRLRLECRYFSDWVFIKCDLPIDGTEFNLIKI